jgi:hypothetical protein
LNWLDHISALNKKLACDVALLHVANSHLPKHTLLTLYYAFFQSHLSYAILYWSSANSNSLQTTKILQKRAIRILSGAEPRSHTQPLAYHLNILLFDDFVYFCKCVFMFNVFNKKLPSVITNMFNVLMYNDILTRQHNMNFVVSRCRLNKRKNFIVHIGPYLWNNLPTNLKLVKSMYIFKQQLISHILSFHNSVFTHS